GTGLGTPCSTTTTYPESRPARHVAFMESQAQQAPATSPPSAARRISAVPLNPVTTWIGSPSAVRMIRAVLSGEAPGAVPPILTGVLAAIHFSMLVAPLA